MRMRKRIGRILLAAVCMAGMLYCDSMAGKAFWVEVTGDNTNLRSTAGTEGSIVDTANKGDRFDVAGETTGSDGSTWYQVSLANQTCYIHADVVKKVEEAAEGTGAAQPVPATSSSSVTPMAAQSATIQKDSVNVRSSADTKADKVATVDAGIAVTVTGTSTDNDGKTWYQVNFINNGSDVTGFIREDMIELGEVMEPVPEEGAAEGAGEGEEPASPEDEAPAEDASNDTAAYELVYTAD